jgi:alanine-synthesizing transaminase
VLPPRGAIYAFPGVDLDKLPGFDDEKFAYDLLERKHVLIAPGSSFNVPYRNHFRITLLPDEKTMADVFGRIEEMLDEYAEAAA